MNTVDIILGIILIFAFYTGLKKGLFVTLASLIGLIAGVYGAIYFSYFASDYLADLFTWSEQKINLAAFAITFLVILLTISLIGKLLTKVADFAALGLINKLFGGVFNTLKFAFIISVIFMYINASSRFSGLSISEDKKAKSVLYEPIASLATFLLPTLLEEVENYRTDDENPEAKEPLNKE